MIDLFLIDYTMVQSLHPRQLSHLGTRLDTPEVEQNVLHFADQRYGKKFHLTGEEQGDEHSMDGHFHGVSQSSTGRIPVQDRHSK
jgi:hypothetical protein